MRSVRRHWATSNVAQWTRTIKDVAVRGYCLRQDSFIASQISVEVFYELKALPEQIFQVLGVLPRRCLPHHILAGLTRSGLPGSGCVLRGERGTEGHALSLRCKLHHFQAIHQQSCKGSITCIRESILHLLKLDGLHQHRQTMAYSEQGPAAGLGSWGLQLPSICPGCAEISFQCQNSTRPTS